MDIKIKARGKVHIATKKGEHETFDIKTDTTGTFKGGENQVDFQVKMRIGRHFNPNVSLAEGNILSVERVTAQGEAVGFSASARKRHNFFRRYEEMLPQMTIDRMEGPADVIVAGVDEEGVRRYAGQVVLPRDGESYTKITPGKEAIGKFTIVLEG